MNSSYRLKKLSIFKYYIDLKTVKIVFQLMQYTEHEVKLQSSLDCIYGLCIDIYE